MKNFKKSILSQLDNLNKNNPKAYWKLIESLKDKDNDSLPLSKDECFNYFKSLNAPQKEFKQQLLNLEQKLLLKEKESLNFNELDFNISEDEVLSAIKKLKRNKSDGLQLITNDILMAGKFQLTPSLTFLFNKILISGIYPGNWSRGYISPIFKSGDRSKPDNYRGIAITGCLSKLLNSILNSRLDIFLIKHKLINPFQIGFTKDSRPSDLMFVLKTLIDKYLHKKEKLFACFVDFRKAFDTVAHTAIYLKLLDMNVGGLFYNLIKDMYKISAVCVKVGQNLTDSFESSIGVRQGDVYGRFIKQNFLLNNKVLDCCNSYKYLGITFSSSGSFTESKTELYKKAVKAFFKLKADVLSLYPMPKTSLHIFDHTVKPILLYCSEIWGCYLPKSADFNFMFDYSRLSSVLPCDKLHINFCKYILGANKTSTNFAILSEL